MKLFCTIALGLIVWNYWDHPMWIAIALAVLYDLAENLNTTTQTGNGE